MVGMMDEVWFAEPVQGHRKGMVDVRRLVLQGLTNDRDRDWQGGIVRARCINGNDLPHETPDATGGEICMCGINAYKLDHPIAELTGEHGRSVMFEVVMYVDLGGRVVEYEHGYRAEVAMLTRATIISPQLLLPDVRVLAALHEFYDAPFNVLSAEEYWYQWRSKYEPDWEAGQEDQDTGAASGAVTIPSGAASGAVTIPSGAVTHSGGTSGGTGQATSVIGSSAYFTAFRDEVMRQAHEALYTGDVLWPLAFLAPSRWQRFTTWWRVHWVEVIAWTAWIALWTWVGSLI